MSAALRPVTAADVDAALSSPRPVLVYFWAPWCGSCRAVKPVLEGVARDYDGRVDILTVDVDTETALADRFGVRSLPTFVLFAGGRVVDGVVGAVPRASLVQRIEAQLAVAVA